MLWIRADVSHCNVDMNLVGLSLVFINPSSVHFHNPCNVLNYNTYFLESVAVMFNVQFLLYVGANK